MANNTSNVVTSSSYGGLFNAPQKNYGGLFSSSASSLPFNPQTTTLSDFILNNAKPTTAVKSVTSGADGSTTVNYHPETATKTAASSAPAAPQPIVGNTTTPSGAVVNTTTGGLVSPPPTPPITFPGLLNNLVSFSQPSQATQQGLDQSGQAFKQSQDYLTKLEQNREQMAQALRIQGNQPIPIGDITGRQQALTNFYGQQQAALGSAAQAASNLYSPGLSAAVTGQGQQIGAAQGAAGLVPEALRYGAVGGAGGLDPQSQAGQLAKLVTTGQMTLPDALSQMGNYGLIGEPALRNAILSLNPSFNFAQAGALATTQGQVAPQLNMAQQALVNLNNTFGSVPSWQKSGIPALNTVANMFSAVTGVGIKTETEKQNAIKEARTQVANALGVMTNTTPTAWTATVESWFPDNATPDQVGAGIQQFNNLAANRQAIYGTPGAVQPFTPDMLNQNAQSNNLYNW